MKPLITFTPLPVNKINNKYLRRTAQILSFIPVVVSTYIVWIILAVVQLVVMFFVLPFRLFKSLQQHWNEPSHKEWKVWILDDD